MEPARRQILNTSASTVRATLRAQGFARFSALDMVPGGNGTFGGGALLGALTAECQDLPPDEYGQGENRYRRHSRAVFFPWSKQLEWLPNKIGSTGERQTEYYQGKFHPDFQGQARLFPAVSQALLADPLMLQLVRQDFDLTFWAEFHQRQPMLLGISFIKMQTKIGQAKAYSTPNTLHQDGETFTFAHLIERVNCAGGENVVAAAEHSNRPPQDLLEAQIQASFILENPLDSYAVHDPAVSHYVGPIHPVDPSRSAARTIMLVDFTPLVSEHQIS